MEIKFTYHALQRIEERKISLHAIAETINSPDQIDESVTGLYKFIKHNKVEGKILICICKMKNQCCTIITALKSSQISKYLK